MVSLALIVSSRSALVLVVLRMRRFGLSCFGCSAFGAVSLAPVVSSRSALIYVVLRVRRFCLPCCCFAFGVCFGRSVGRWIRSFWSFFVRGGYVSFVACSAPRVARHSRNVSIEWEVRAVSFPRLNIARIITVAKAVGRPAGAREPGDLRIPKRHPHSHTGAPKGGIANFLIEVANR